MKTKGLVWGISVAIFLFWLSTAIWVVVLSPWLYHLAIDWFFIESLTHLEKGRLMENYWVLLHYLINPFQHVLTFPDFISSSQGLFHFYEVKRLLQWSFVLWMGSGMTCIWAWKYTKKNSILYQLIFPLRMTLVFPIFVGSMSFFNFEKLFIGFHKVLFNNNAWIFDPRTDPIILALPQEFFLSCFVLAAIVLFGGVGLTLLGVKFTAQSRHKS